MRVRAASRGGGTGGRVFVRAAGDAFLRLPSHSPPPVWGVWSSGLWSGDHCLVAAAARVHVGLSVPRAPDPGHGTRAQPRRWGSKPLGQRIKSCVLAARRLSYNQAIQNGRARPVHRAPRRGGRRGGGHGQACRAAAAAEARRGRPGATTTKKRAAAPRARARRAQRARDRAALRGGAGGARRRGQEVRRMARSPGTWGTSAGAAGRQPCEGTRPGACPQARARRTGEEGVRGATAALRGGRWAR